MRHCGLFHNNALEQMKERVKEMKKDIDSDEPLFYMAFVVRGTGQQYLNLLEYIKKQNGGKIIYQCRSLTYLYISKTDPKKWQSVPPEFSAKIAHSKKLQEVELK